MAEWLAHEAQDLGNMLDELGMLLVIVFVVARIYILFKG